MIFDERTERNIATLLPVVQARARLFMERCLLAGLPVRIISGARTYQEQDELYAQGRTAPGRVVTFARGGYSNHNFGVAFDVGMFPCGAYVGESRLYRVAGGVGKQCGFEWGGDWKSIVDEPHFEWPTGHTLAEMRTLVSLGKSIL